MLPSRTETILNFIVTQYIGGAIPVPSHRITKECELGVSSATIRNEMAYLEEEGYITRPHTSAGAVPADKGYRHYVDSLRDVTLPLAEQRMVSHLFHQVERKLEEWLSLAATLVARSAQNVAVITMPKPADCQFKYLELVSLQDTLALIVLVLRGAKILKQLITFDIIITQQELTAIANKLNAAYPGLSRSQIKSKSLVLTPLEQQMTDCVIKMMQAEDEITFEEPYLEGWHFMLTQPEFAQSQRLLALTELIEQKHLLEAIGLPETLSHKVQVVIGKENKADVIKDYSVVISRYGLPDEAIGAIGVLGPTRMPYARAISTVAYLSSVLSELIANLYGRESDKEQDDAPRTGR